MNRLPPAHQPSGIMPAQRPACPPETAAPRRRPAGARPDGSAEQPAPVQAERQASRRAGTTEQASRRQSRNSPTQPHHQPPPPTSRPTTPSRRPCNRSNPTQPQRPERSRERVQRRGGGRGAARPSVQISRPGHNMPNTPPTAQGRPSRSDPAPAPPESNRNRPPCCAAVLLLERMQNQRPRNPRRATGDSPTRQQ